MLPQCFVCASFQISVVVNFVNVEDFLITLPASSDIAKARCLVKKYMFKSNVRKTRTMYNVSLKVTIKTPEQSHCYFAFNANFKEISHFPLSLVAQSLMLNFCLLTALSRRLVMLLYADWNRLESIRIY